MKSKSSKLAILTLILIVLSVKNELAEAVKGRQVLLKVRDLDNHAMYEYCGVLKHRSPFEQIGRRPDGSFRWSRYLSMLDVSHDSPKRTCADLNSVAVNNSSSEKWKIVRYFDAVHVQFEDSFRRCSVNEFIKSVKLLTTKMVILGTHLFNLQKRDFYYSENYTSLVLLPNEYSDEIKYLASKSKNLAVKIDEFSLFDHGHVILWIFAFFIVFAGALWNKHEFWKRNQKAANEVRKKVTQAITLHDIDAKENDKYDIEVLIDKSIFSQIMRCGGKNVKKSVLTEPEAEPPQTETETPKTESESESSEQIESENNNTNNNEEPKEVKVETRNEEQPKLNETKIITRNLRPTFKVINFKQVLLTNVERLIGFDTIFIICIIWFVVLVELIHFKLFPIEVVRYGFSIAGFLCLYLCLYSFVENIYFVRPTYPYISNIPFGINVLCTILASFLPVYYLVISITEKEYVWYVQNLIGVAICLALIGMLRIQRFINVCLIGLICWAAFAFLQFVTPLYNKGVSFSDSALSEIISITQQRTVTYNEDGMKVPGMFWMPVFSNPRALCQLINPNLFSFMSFIDIIVPGFFISYAISFDSAKSDRKFLYFSSNIIFYMITMMITSYAFSVGNLTNSTVIVTIPGLVALNILISFLKQEFKDYMTGKSIKKAWNDAVTDAAREVCQDSNKISNISIVV